MAFSLSQFLHKLVNHDFKPFNNISEVLIAHKLDQAGQPILFSTLVDTLGHAVARRDISLSLGSLRNHNFVSEDHRAFSLTDQGRAAVQKIIREKKDAVQAYLTSKHSGLQI